MRPEVEALLAKLDDPYTANPVLAAEVRREAAALIRELLRVRVTAVEERESIFDRDVRALVGGAAHNGLHLSPDLARILVKDAQRIATLMQAERERRAEGLPSAQLNPVGAPADPPPQEPGLSLIFIVNGEEVPVAVSPLEPLRVGMDRALRYSNKAPVFVTLATSSSPKDWELRHDSGRLLDPESNAQDNELRSGAHLFLTLRVGAGGK
jgi:hypothetical protein